MSKLISFSLLWYSLFNCILVLIFSVKAVSCKFLLFQYGAGDAFGPQSSKHGLSGEEIENKSKLTLGHSKFFLYLASTLAYKTYLPIRKKQTELKVKKQQ